MTNKGAFPVDEIQKIQLLFFSIYRFKVIIDVLLQQEHDTLKNWREHTTEARTVVKQQNWGGIDIVYKNQMFLRLKYMPA